MWRDGWWTPARHVPSPNFGPRPDGEQPGLVVLHSISLPPGVYRGPAVEQLFGNTLDFGRHPYFAALRTLRVSAHFLLRRDGQVVQFVSCEQRAWHAGVSRWRGRDNCNDWSIGIEIEGLEGRTFPSVQYRVLARLLRAVVVQHPIAEIVGHEHVAPGRKCDPGPGFDWMRLRRRLRGCDVGVWPLLHAKA
jgi:AmpD protein